MKSILLVEDDPFISEIYAETLKREGYQVGLAKDGEMAWNKILTDYPDLVLLDINIPKINGWELLRMARGDARTKNLKVMVITNISKEDFPEDAGGFGVLRYFLKVETTPEEIARAVKGIL